MSVGKGEGPRLGEVHRGTENTGCEDPQLLVAGQCEEQRDGIEAVVRAVCCAQKA